MKMAEFFSELQFFMHFTNIAGAGLINYKSMWIIIYTNLEVQIAKSSNNFLVFDFIVSEDTGQYNDNR